MTDFIQVMTTTETKQDAQRIANTLLEERLAGCVQLIGPMTSLYRWKEAIETAEEWFCLIKSRRELYGAVERTIRQIHPYEEPEIIAIPVVAGSSGYLDWLDAALHRPQG